MRKATKRLAIRLTLATAVAVWGAASVFAAISIAVNEGSVTLNLMAGDSQTVTVTENSDDASGYTVTLTSANGGNGDPKLRRGSSTDTIAYTIRYGGVPVSLAGGRATVTDVATTANGVQKDMVIAVAAQAATTPSGTYADSLTLDIAGK